jgi:adenylate kinase
MKNRIIALTGVPGSGKTTVLKKALSMTSNVSVVNFADVMLGVGEELGLGSDHDAIRKQPLDVQKELQKKAAKKIAKDASGITIVDTHATIKTKDGYLPGLPQWVLSVLNPSTIVIVEASSKDINLRRQMDKSRSRDDDGEVGIELHQELNRAISLAYAAASGATVKIIINEQNKLEEASKTLLDLLGGN